MTTAQLEQARLDYGGIISAIVAVFDPHAPRGLAWSGRPRRRSWPLAHPRRGAGEPRQGMNSYVLRSLIRAAAFRVMRRAPLWLAIAILAIGFVLEHGR